MSMKQRLKLPLLKAVFGFGKFRGISGRQKSLDADQINRIMVIQLGGIGDVLMIFPLLRQLRENFPDKSLLTLTEYGDWLFALAPDLSDGITHQRLDLSLGYREKLGQIRSFSKGGIDLVISTARGDGAVESSLIAWLTGAGIRIGYRQEGSALLYTHTRDFSYQVPIVEQNLGMLELLKCSSVATALGLTIAEEVAAEAKRLLEQPRELGGAVITFHPFAGNFAEFKSWPVTRYAQLANMLIDRYSASIIVLGSARDRALWEEACPLGPKQGVTNLCGEISFPKSAAIIKQSDLFIGNDSSLLHLAESFGIPAIGIFGSTSPAQILPRGHGTVVVRHDPGCAPCYLHQPLHRHRCLNEAPLKCLHGLAVNHVFDVAADQLTSWRGDRPCALP
jgi:ADP-heptose:LPS heptosyltransferase